MEENKIISMSENGKSEYCCNVIQIGKLESIEGSDFLAKTHINGESIVVRKDQVFEGEYYLYASNECALNEKFLSKNNLYELSEASRNSNANEVVPVIERATKIKKSIEAVDKDNKKLSRVRRLFEAKQDTENNYNKAVQMLKDLKLVTSYNNADEYLNYVMNLIANNNSYKDELIKERDKLIDSVKNKVGFFNKHGRVRCIKLKGTPSYGFIFSKSELSNAFPDAINLKLEDHLGEDFDTVCSELFVKAYVPPVKSVKEHVQGSGKNLSKRADRFDRMVPGEFKFHYDTQPLGKNMWKFEPDDIVIIDNKIHGSQACFSNIKTKYPNKLNIFKKVINVIYKHFKKEEKYPTYHIDYGFVYSSRKVIKNKDINPNQSQGYYNSDIWGYWAEKIKEYVPKNWSIYGEIYGYTPDGSYIQKDYDYGCKSGESKFTPYRISIHDPETDDWTEMNKEDVYNWTVDLLNKHPELHNKLVPIDIFYHGRFRDLYPNIKVNSEWHDNVLYAMQADTENFGMELMEPLCVNVVPREGLIIRKDNDKVPEAFKLKTDAFKAKERQQIDEGIVDSETVEGYTEE
jgi:hypothetical protein